MGQRLKCPTSGNRRIQGCRAGLCPAGAVGRIGRRERSPAQFESEHDVPGVHHGIRIFTDMGCINGGDALKVTPGICPRSVITIITPQVVRNAIVGEGNTHAMFPPSAYIVHTRHCQGRGVYEIAGSRDIARQVRNVAYSCVTVVAGAIERNRIGTRCDSSFKAGRVTGQRCRKLDCVAVSGEYPLTAIGGRRDEHEKPEKQRYRHNISSHF